MTTWLTNVLGVESTTELVWVLIGLGGQVMFMMRFLIQWIVSEREKRSVIPVAFWYFSIFGAAILLAYAIWRRDPVFILGQSLGFFIYSRNLWLIFAERKQAEDASNNGI